MLARMQRTRHERGAPARPSARLRTGKLRANGASGKRWHSRPVPLHGPYYGLTDGSCRYLNRSLSASSTTVVSPFRDSLYASSDRRKA
jgi:hypothetical protein